jgi:hypothetical protein
MEAIKKTIIYRNASQIDLEKLENQKNEILEDGWVMGEIKVLNKHDGSWVEVSYEKINEPCVKF